MDLAGRLRERMRVRGHWKPAADQPNVKAAADATGISYATLYDIVHGRTKEPKRETMEVLAREYGVTVDWLLYGPQRPNGGTFEQGAEFALEAMREAIARVEHELVKRRVPPEDDWPATRPHEPAPASEAELASLRNRRRA